MTKETLGEDLGTRATMVQFSSAFCAPCRATHTLLSALVEPMHDVKHIQIDAESHLELVRQLDIRSTPTTLFINRDGIEVGRAVGTPKKEQALAALEAIQ
jgi:thiol-disulfide isomerase/thioredoxin